MACNTLGERTILLIVPVIRKIPVALQLPDHGRTIVKHRDKFIFGHALTDAADGVVGKCLGRTLEALRTGIRIRFRHAGLLNLKTRIHDCVRMAQF